MIVTPITTAYLSKSERSNMKVNRLRKLTVEVKDFKSLNRDIMHTYFKKGSRSVSRKMAKTLQSLNLEFST